NVPQDAVPAAPAAERGAETEIAADTPPAAQPPSATEEPEPSAGDPDHESVASVPLEQPAAVYPSVGSSPSPQSDGPRGDIAREAAPDLSLPRPLEMAAEPSVAAIDQAIDATAATATAPAEEAPGGQPTFAQTPVGTTVAALNPETEPTDSHP